MKPHLKSPKIGDDITAKHEQDVVRAINSMSSKTVQTVASGYDTLGSFEPYFYYDSGSLYVSIRESHFGNNQADVGTHEFKIPEFEGSPIINPSISNIEWEPPKLAMSNGDWEMFLVVGVSAGSDSVEIIVQTEGTSDPTPNPPWKNVY